MFTVQVDGLDQLARTLRELPQAVEKKTVSNALKAGAQPIRGMASAIMARGKDAPHAADNVGVTVGRSGHSIAIGPTKDFFYWLFQEFGTVRNPAQPALRPAFDTHAPTALRLVGRDLWNAIEKRADTSSRTSGGGSLL